ATVRADRGRYRRARAHPDARRAARPACGGCAVRRGRTPPSHCRSAAPPTTCPSRGYEPSRASFREQCLEVTGRRRGKIFDAFTAQAGEEMRGIDDEAGLAGLAPM